jgi:hypothetical protein
MQERVKIAEIDIGVDKLMEKTGQATKRITELGDANKNLKKETDGLKNATKEQLAEFTKNEVQLKNLRKEKRDSIKVMEAYIHIQNQEIKTKQQARDANSKLIAIANQLDATNEDQAATLKKVNAEIDKNTEFIKDNASGYERDKINIGGYEDAIKSALGELGIFGQAQQKVNQVTSAGGHIINFVSTNLKQVKKDYKKATAETYGMSKAQVAAHLTSTTLAAGLKILKLALIATGIGAFVVVVGSLIAYLSKTQAGIDLVNKVLAGAGAAFDVVIDRVAKFGGALMKFLSGDIKGGIEGMTKSFEGMGDEIQREINLAMKLEKVFQDVERAEINLSIRRKAANKELRDLNKTVEDQTKTQEERLKAAEKFSKIEQGLVAEEVANQEKRVAAMLGFAEVTDEARKKIEEIGEAGVENLNDLGISESTVADLKEFETAIGSLFDVQTRSLEVQTTNQNKLNAIRKEAAAQERAEAKAIRDAAIEAQKERIEAAKAATEAAISESKTRLEIFIEENKGKADSLAESIKIEEEVRDKKLAILQEELEAKKVTYSEYELQVLQTKNEFLDKQQQLAKDHANEELRIQKEKQDRLKEEAQLKAEAEATDLQNKLAIEEENFFAKMDLERERLEQQRQMELEAAEKTGANKVLINEKFDKLIVDNEKAVQDAKLSMAADTFGAMSKLLGEESKAGKAFALAQALVNTYLGITKALTLPFPANLAAAATTAATGFAAVKNITSTKTPKAPKAEKGAVLDIGGRRHSQGGTTFYDGAGNPVVEAEAGEKMVILKREASKELAVLSALNQKHGGVSLSQPVTYANNGGVVPRIAQTGNSRSFKLDYSKMGEAVGSYVSQNINSLKIVVPVDRVTEVADQTAKVERGADF